MAIEGELYGTSLCGETFLETSGDWVLPTEYSPTASSPVGMGYELLNTKWGGLSPPNEKLRRTPTIVKRVSHPQYSLIGRTRDMVLDEFAAFHKTLMPSVPPTPSPNKSPHPHATFPTKPPPRSSICESASPTPPHEDPEPLAISDPIISKPEVATDDASLEDNTIPTPSIAVNPPVETTRTRVPRRRQSTSLASGSSPPPAKVIKSRNQRSKGVAESPNKRRKNTPSRANSSIIRCTWSNCPKTFTRAHDRLRHIDSVHTKGKPFLCQYCPAAYARKDALQRHFTTCALNPDPNKAKPKPNTSAGKDGLS